MQHRPLRRRTPGSPGSPVNALRRSVLRRRAGDDAPRAVRGALPPDWLMPRPSLHPRDDRPGPASGLERALLARPPVRLLLQAARAVPPADLGAAVARAVADGLDWDEVVRLARSHRLVPHVAPALAGEAAVPEAIRRRLLAASRRHAYRQLRMAGALGQALGALGEAGVPSLPLKGPTLASWLFGDPARRTSADLDVLIAPGSVGPAVAAVRRLGFEGRGPVRLLAPAEAEVVAREFTLKDAAFYHPALGVALELHWRPFRDRRLRAMTGALRAGLRLDHPARPDVGPPAAVAAYVLAHGALHGYRRLTWLVDAAALARRLDDDQWGEVLGLAEADRVSPAVLLGPFLAHRLLGAPLPGPLHAAVSARGPQLQRLADRCRTETPDDYGETRLGHLALQAGLYDRVRDRARFVARYLLAPADGELDGADLQAGPLARLRRRAARPVQLAANGGRWALGAVGLRLPPPHAPGDRP